MVQIPFEMKAKHAYSEPCETSKIDPSAKIVNGFVKLS